MMASMSSQCKVDEGRRGERAGGDQARGVVVEREHEQFDILRRADVRLMMSNALMCNYV
jgi:hypothetical protein